MTIGTQQVDVSRAGTSEQDRTRLRASSADAPTCTCYDCPCWFPPSIPDETAKPACTHEGMGCDTTTSCLCIRPPSPPVLRPHPQHRQTPHKPWSFSRAVTPPPPGLPTWPQCSQRQARQSAGRAVHCPPPAGHLAQCRGWAPAPAPGLHQAAAAPAGTGEPAGSPAAAGGRGWVLL
jgi:hypothetical protein